jgi:purine-binding chemotaxis protein CheW
MSQTLDRFFFAADEAVGAFLELAPEVERRADTDREELTEEFLAFRLENEVYAVPLGALREIVKMPPLTFVPRAPKLVLGVMNLRGEMVPVYDIKPRLRLDSSPEARNARSARVLLLRDAQGDCGVLVDEVQGVVRLPLTRLEGAPLPGMEAVAGVGRRGDEIYILLDLEQALDG